MQFFKRIFAELRNNNYFDLCKQLLAKTQVWRYNMRPDNIKINIKFKGDDIFNDK